MVIIRKKIIIFRKPIDSLKYKQCTLIFGYMQDHWFFIQRHLSMVNNKDFYKLTFNLMLIYSITLAMTE